MAQKLPNEHPDVSDTAVDATVGQALAGAGRVLGNAGVNDPTGDALDRLSVGLPPTDPVPVGVPQGLVGGPSTPPLPSPPPAVQSAQADSAGVVTGTSPPPAHTYVANRLMRDHGAVHVAHRLRGWATGDGGRRRVAAAASSPLPGWDACSPGPRRGLGADHRGAERACSDAAGTGRRGCGTLNVWQLAAEAYHSHAEGLAQEADAIGLPGTGAAIRQTAQTYDPASGAATASLKTAVAQAHLDQIDHAGRRAAAARLFTQRLLNHGPRA